MLCAHPHSGTMLVHGFAGSLVENGPARVYTKAKAKNRRN